MSFFATTAFDASKVEPATGFEPIPDGMYAVMVDKAEEKACGQDKSGLQLVVQLRVLEGKYAKRTIFARINLHNKSAKCVEIGRAELSAFCRATGVMTPKAPHEFANRTLQVHVKVVKRQDNGQLANEVAKYEPMGSAVAGLVQAGTSAPSQPNAPAATAPWAK